MAQAKIRKIDSSKWAKAMLKVAADIDAQKKKEKQERLKYEREHCTCCPVHPRRDFLIGGR